MDPTAPNDNQNNPPNDQNTQNNPVQPGQFVVAGEPGPPPMPGDIEASQTQPNIAAQSPFDISQQQPAPTGSQLAGEPQPISPMDPGGATAQFNASAPAFSPAASTQPDPTPFAVQGAPIGQQVQSPQPQVPPGSGSKMAKLKIVAIVVALIILIVLIFVLLWFFVLNKKSNVQVNTTTQQPESIEEPAISSPTTDSGFGNLPQATDEAVPTPADESVTTPPVPL